MLTGWESLSEFPKRFAEVTPTCLEALVLLDRDDHRYGFATAGELDFCARLSVIDQGWQVSSSFRD